MSAEGEAAAALSAPVRELLAEFRLESGQVVIAADKLTAWQTRLSGEPIAAKESLVFELAVVATRFQRMGGEAAEAAVLNLCQLMAALAASPAQVKDAYAKAGLQPSG